MSREAAAIRAAWERVRSLAEECDLVVNTHPGDLYVTVSLKREGTAALAISDNAHLVEWYLMGYRDAQAEGQS